MSKKADEEWPAKVERRILSAEEVLFRNFLIDLAKHCARDAVRADPGVKPRLLDIVQNIIPRLATQVKADPAIVEQLQALSGEIQAIALSGRPVGKPLGHSHRRAQQNAGIAAGKPDRGPKN